MLVLTRKKNESIVINDVIRVTVVEIRGDKVRLGIEAPRNIEVHREEIYDQIHGKQAEARNDQGRSEAQSPAHTPAQSGDSSSP